MQEGVKKRETRNTSWQDHDLGARADPKKSFHKGVAVEERLRERMQAGEKGPERAKEEGAVKG